MYIYNTTFMILPSSEPQFLSWLRLEALPMLVNEALPARSPRLTKIAEIPADPEMTAQSASYAFQVEFKALEDAKKWADSALNPVCGNFASKFNAGDGHAAVFSTILLTIDL